MDSPWPIFSLNDRNVYVALDWSIGPPYFTWKQYVGLLHLIIDIDRRQLRCVADCVHETVELQDMVLSFTNKSRRETDENEDTVSFTCEENRWRSMHTPHF